MTRDELVELLTVERFAPWRPPAPEPARRRRRARVVAVVGLDDPGVIEARRRAVDEEARALWHDDADHALDEPLDDVPASPTHERTA